MTNYQFFRALDNSVCNGSKLRSLQSPKITIRFITSSFFLANLVIELNFQLNLGKEFHLVLDTNKPTRNVYFMRSAR